MYPVVFLFRRVMMPKQNNNAGLGTNGPHKQGEKGGKGGTFKGGASSGGKKLDSQSSLESGADANRRAWAR